MRRILLLLVVLAACKRGGRKPPDAAALHGLQSPPFRIELEGTRPGAVIATPDGGAVVGLAITRPIAIAGTTFTPQRGMDAVIVALAPDGQPRAAVSFGLDGTESVRVTDLARQADGSVRVGLITSSALPNARLGPTEGPEPGGEIYTLATVELGRGVVDEIAIGPVAPGGTTALAALPDGGAIVARNGSYTALAQPASVVTRIDAAGERAWEQRHDARVIDGFAADGDDLLALYSSARSSGAVHLDRAGADLEECAHGRAWGARGHTPFAWRAGGTWNLLGVDEHGVYRMSCEAPAAPVLDGVASILDAAPPRVVVRVLSGTLAPGLYALRLDGGAPVAIDGPPAASRAAVLADGGVLVVGACDAQTGCLVRSNP